MCDFALLMCDFALFYNTCS